MTPEQHPEHVEALNDYVDALVAARKPAAAPHLKELGPETLYMATMLASAESPHAQPSAAFVQDLGRRIGSQRRWRSVGLSRRGFAGALAAIAAAAVALVLDRDRLPGIGRGQFVPTGWIPVAQVAELPPGSVKRFTAGDVQGHVMNIGGSIWALSAICTHLSCTLNWWPEKQEFLCPCHGAEFETSGEQTGAETYDLPLPPLPRLPVQQLNGTVYLVP